MILRSRSTWDTQWVQDNPEHQSATYSQNKKQEEGWGCGSVAKYLPSIHEILESVPSTTKTKSSTGYHSDSHYVTRRGLIWAERTQNVVNVGYVLSIVPSTNSEVGTVLPTLLIWLCWAFKAVIECWAQKKNLHVVCDSSNAFQGLRESCFYSTFSSSLCQGGPEYEVGIYNSLLIKKSRHQSQVSWGNHSVRRAKKIMKCSASRQASGPCDSVSREAQVLLWLSCEYGPECPVS